MPLRPVLHLVARPQRTDPVPAPGLHPNPSIESNALLRGTREVLIRHGGETYRLRHTRNDKLILTK
ncbi:hemin uptake protein HemP [Lysobacter solisilvae (ex Woo and Kim 2020)]|uniref:Hemin uptake protein HemP n=1 Tax=Agrilutibacter terrestris TaxID=2865112 RepID=A0A7H0FUW5_9GAMM|nr:hemin uptake protein HemP [Lysobacter terrestris]QNP39831.1 hemin uptake protein HemP [Lysobacter terrestris]